jgi:hypothetical protein
MTPAHPVALTGSDQALRAVGPGVYRGFAIRETAGAVATIQIYDNASAATGTLLDTIRLAANESAREWYGNDGIWFQNGVYVKIVAGTVEGSVRVG